MTQVASALATGPADIACQRLVQSLQGKLNGATPALVTVFASTAQPLEAVLPQIKRAFPGAAVLGSTTAGEFTEEGDAKGSVAAFALATDCRIVAGIGTGLKADVEGAVRQALSGVPAKVAGYPYRTGILLLDPLSGTGEEATLLAASMLDSDTPLVGGAAGDDLKMTRTEVGLDARTAADAVVCAVLFSKAPPAVGVCHGHGALSGPMKVTKAEGNTVYEVDGRPAWQVWIEATRAAALKLGQDPTQLRPEEIGPYLLTYEAGLDTGRGAMKIRAPLSKLDSGALNFACGIPEGATIRITESQPERQIESAREAARLARASLGTRDVAGALVFDCICRNLILGSEFGTAIRGISAELGGAPLAGFETYGEIALGASNLSGFHNTTTVVLAFPT